MDPAQNSPAKEFTFQKYLLLQTQHDALHKHLDLMTTSLPPTAFSSFQPTHLSRHTSRPPSSGSDNSYLSSAPLLTSQNQQHRGGSIPNAQHVLPSIITRGSSLPAIINENIFREIEADKTKLRNVNEQIKCTLTNLLNSAVVKGNTGYRLWVQTRLMDVEKELTSSRSRVYERRSAGV